LRGPARDPVRAPRDGRALTGTKRDFKPSGPPSDGTDVMPGPDGLPADLRPGDYLEFGSIGAYSLAGRTSFNGHFSDDVVTVTDRESFPPRVG
jgi:ornithine decarboxylase